MLPGDVRDLAGDVIAHRLVPSFDALADGVGVRPMVDAIVAAVRAPRIAPAEALDGDGDGGGNLDGGDVPARPDGGEGRAA